MRARSRDAAAGFTLLEMAIVTVIIGIMAWGFMTFMEDYIAREKIEEGRRNAEFAVEQMQGYIIGNTGKLPDPRTGNLLPLDIANHRDPWGNELRYWRADELDGKAVDDVDSTQMYIRFFANAADLASLSSPTKTIGNVAYVVISHGKDGIQSFTQTPGSIYINMLQDGTPTSNGGNFDDILQYKTLPQVRTVFAASGLSGANKVDSPAVSQDPALAVKGGETGTGDSLIGNSTYVAPGADVGIVTNTGVGSGQALSLGGGEEDYVNLTQDTDDYQFATYTVMCWFKTDADYDASERDAFGVLTARSNNSSARTWWLTIWGGGYSQNRAATDDPNPRNTLAGDLALKTGNGFIIFTHKEPQVRYDDQQWHFVAATVRESGASYEAELYVDGEVLDTQTRSSHPPTGSGYEFYIGSGSSSYNDNRRFEGLIDEFYIFGSESEDQSLTTDEINAYYQASKGSFGY